MLCSIASKRGVQPALSGISRSVEY